MDALTEKGFRDFMATGVRPPVVETAIITIEDKPDPMFQLLTNLCAVGMLAKDLHYRSKGKAFYAVHLLSDLVYDASRLFDEINEVYYMGECGSVPPRMAKVSAKAAELANSCLNEKCHCLSPDAVESEDNILSCLLARCKTTAGCVEDCKSLAPKSGTNAVLDEVSKKMLQSIGLLKRTETNNDAAMKYLSTCSNQERQTLDESLEEHDKKYHPDGYKEGDECNKREEMAKNDDPIINETKPTSQGEELAGKSDADKISNEITNGFNAAGLTGHGEIYVTEEGNSYEVEGVINNPFPSVDYTVGENRGYRDVWEDEAEIEEYKGKFEDVICDIADKFKCDTDRIEWKSEDDGRGGSDFRFYATFKRVV